MLCLIIIFYVIVDVFCFLSFLVMSFLLFYIVEFSEVPPAWGSGPLNLRAVNATQLHKKCFAVSDVSPHPLNVEVSDNLFMCWWYLRKLCPVGIATNWRRLPSLRFRRTVFVWFWEIWIMIPWKVYIWPIRSIIHILIWSPLLTLIWSISRKLELCTIQLLVLALQIMEQFLLMFLYQWLRNMIL